MIKDQFLNAMLLQTGDPMWSIAHPSKLEERKCWRLGLRVEVKEERRSRHSDSRASTK